MNKLSERVIFWFNAARGYSSPISILSWSVPFVFGISAGGNSFYGILALIGIVLVHLGVNLFDDVIDYYLEQRNIRIGKSSVDSLNLQKGKCQYIIEGIATLLSTLLVALSFFAVAVIIGTYLTLMCGWPVVAIVLLTGILCILYPVLTYFALGEFVVGFIFAPMLYMGTYFVMTKSFSLEIMLISISTGLLTVGLLHTHTFMDYDFDLKNNKKTLCALLGTKDRAVTAQGVILLLAYLNIVICVLLALIPKTMLLTLFSIPTAVSLYKLLRLHVEDPEIVVKRRFWMGPMENWESIKKNNLESFMIKFLLARNVMMVFTIFVCIAKILSEISI